jgi:CubicO group peptidase (beta-lactamase class C family)
MPDTVVRLDADQQARAAVGHTRRLRPRAVAWQFDAMSGAGALWSTAADLRRFLAAQLEPRVGLLGDAIRLTQQPHLKTGRTAHGLAWMGLPPMSRVSGFFHNGGTAGFRSMVTVSPAAGAAVAALTSSDRSVDGVGMTMLQSLTAG